MADTSGGAGAPAAKPMFYEKPELIEPDKYGAIGIEPFNGYAYAKEANAIPVVINEMPIAARSYPLVFIGPEGRLMPVAITSLRRKGNLFVSASGEWLKPHYVLGYVRRYPFIFLRDEERQKYALCVDAASDRLKEGGAEPLIKDGEMTNVTKQALEFCTEFQKGVSLTENAMKTLQDMNLFATRRGNFKLDDGETLSITDFSVINEEKLKDIKEDDVLKLFNSGALSMIYAQLISMHGWAQLAQMEVEKKKKG